MNWLYMNISCASHRGSQEACYELHGCTCACSAVYTRFALLLMISGIVPNFWYPPSTWKPGVRYTWELSWRWSIWVPQKGGEAATVTCNTKSLDDIIPSLVTDVHDVTDLTHGRCCGVYKHLIYIHMLCRLEAFSLVDLWYVPLRRIFIGWQPTASIISMAWHTPSNLLKYPLPIKYLSSTLIRM
jgi:hypothetical protein